MLLLVFLSRRRGSSCNHTLELEMLNNKKEPMQRVATSNIMKMQMERERKAGDKMHAKMTSQET